MKIILRITGVVTGLVLVVACSGGSSSSSSGRIDLDVPDTPQPASFGLLKPVQSEKELADSLHAGLQGSGYVTGDAEELVLAAPVPDASEGGDAADGFGNDSFSGTNIQELGVDEADTVKYDGEILYVLASGQGDVIAFEEELAAPDASVEALSTSIAEPRGQTISLYRTDTGVPSAEEVGRISIAPQDSTAEGLYLSETSQGRQLVGVGSNSPYVYWELFASDYYWRDNETRVQAWDVNDPQNPSSAWSITLDGNLLASRRIDNLLYLVTRYSPVIEGVIAYPQSEAEVDANRTLIDETPLAELLPGISHDGGVREDLLAATDCYVPNESFEEGDVLPSGGSLITVTVVDLEAPAQTRSICLNAWSSGYYASSQAIYITANGSENSTLIHKIALTDSGPQYRGSGEVPGYIGTSNPAFGMSEHNGDLRVVSSRWDMDEFPLQVSDVDGDTSAEPAAPEDDGFGRHRLSVLRESADGSRLEQIAGLPNASRPALIGKPGENVYATRFVGDRAYIVTFQVIDPLYVLDLSNPEDPQITGELEIPGFSTLLQPVGENLLLGVGQDVPVADLALTQGVKVALFDVANVAAPVSLGEVVIGKRGSYSPALNNHHALTLLNVDGIYRAAIPIQRHETVTVGVEDPGNPWQWYDWSDSGLYMFDINPASGSLAHSGTLIVAERESDEYPYYSGSLYGSRSVIHNEAVFFLYSGEVAAQFWGE